MNVEAHLPVKHYFLQNFPSEEFITEIFLEEDLLEDPNFFTKVKKLGSSFALITDSLLDKLYSEEVLLSFSRENIPLDLIVIPADEPHKTRETKAYIEDRLIQLGKGRDTVLIAFGGGVVSDITGFVASTYCRGIPYVTIPTTLLSMVDASIGGKTSVNIGPYKNMIGTFYPPKILAMDTRFLKSLSDHHWRNGSAEIIKYGLIADSEIITTLTDRFIQWQKRDPLLVTEIIRKCVEIKCHIVSEDPKEKGFRRVLNFGHTVGHAIESLENYTMGHGDAIAFGMCMESYISMRLGKLPAQDFSKILNLLLMFGFPLKPSENISLDKLETLMSLDKKSTADATRFVILERIGGTDPCSGDFCRSVDSLLIKDAFEWLSCL
ncbi:MAG: 3-dehydroquinate synthase [Chlamydiae bacterium]|nr:3-dehydroquinate synthase [Chlamydiota bacterium]